MKDIIVLYHNDEDGFAGAWAAWKKFKDKAQYISAGYTLPPKPNFRNKEIYLIDFCYNSKAVMEALLKNNRKVVVIDHHVTQKEYVEIATQTVYSEQHSGATLAWQYFHSQKPIPKLLLYVEDMDLWRFKRKHTREIIAALDSYPFEFKIWNKIYRDFQRPGGLKKYLAEGRAIIKYQDILIKDLADSGVKVTIDGQPAIAVNSPLLHSEIGHYIWKNYPKTAGIIWNSTNGRIKVSLRSDKTIDVSKIAKKFGGGGHKTSAGFSIDAEMKFPWKKTGK